MNHPIKPTTFTIILGAAMLLTGCGETQAEKAAKERERQRIEQEKQAQADAEKANKAITTNNQKMFGRMNASSPGASTSEATTLTTTQNSTTKK